MSKLTEVGVVAAVTALVTVMATAVVQNWKPPVPVTATAYTMDVPRPELQSVGEPACEGSECSPERLYAQAMRDFSYEGGVSVAELIMHNRSSVRVSHLEFRAPYIDFAVSCSGRILCERAGHVPAGQDGLLQIGEIEPGHTRRTLVIFDQRSFDERAYSLALPDGRAVKIDYLNDDGFTSIGILGLIRRHVPTSEFVVLSAFMLGALFLVAAFGAPLLAGNFPLMTKFNTPGELVRMIQFADYLRHKRPDLAMLAEETAPRTETREQ